MMKKRHVLSALLSVVIVLNMVVPAFALDPRQGSASVPSDEPSDGGIYFDPTQIGVIDIIEESYMRDGNRPTKFHNLDGQPYGVEGTFDTSIYTSYYFYPNAQGKFYYNMKFEWQVANISGFAVQRGAGVECWDRTTHRKVTDATFEMKLQANGSYSLVIETGNRVVSNLDPTHQYYFCFTKAHDGYNALVTGTIHT